MFFVATAPRATTGTSTSRPRATTRSACSTPNRVAYLDLTGSGVETIAHLRENGRITLMACAFAGNPRISRLYGTGTVHRARLARVRRARAALPELPGSAGDHRRRRRPRHDLVRLRGAADGPRRRPRPPASSGPRRRATTASSSTGPAKNAESIDGLPGLRAREPTPRASRACAGAHGRARRRRAAAVGRRRPAVPHRLRGDAARAADDARAAARRATRTSSCRGSKRRASRRSPTCSRSCRGTRPTTRSRSSRASSVRRGACRDRRPHVGALRARPATARCRAPRSCARRDGRRPDPHGEGRRRDRGAAAGRRARSTSVAAEMRARPFAGRTELDVHRELVERMLADGHERANFAIVAAGEHAASPHHEPSADRVDRRRRHRAVRLRRHDAAATAPTSRACSTSASRRREVRDVYAVLAEAQEAGVRAATVGTPCEDVDAAARARHRRGGLRRVLRPPRRARHRHRGARGSVHGRGQRTRRSRPATRSASSPASTCRAGSACGSRTSSSQPPTARSA